MKNKELTRFLVLQDAVRDSGGTVYNKLTDEIQVLITDILYDISLEDKVITPRIFKNVQKIFDLDSKKTEQVISKITDVYKKKKLLECQEIDIAMLFSNEVNEMTKGRAPKLTGRAEKARKSKADVMSEVNKSEKVKQAKTRLMNIINREVKRVAKEKGIQPNLINLDKITIKN